MEQLVDDLSDTSVGYSFLKDRRNCMLPEVDALLSALLKDKDLKSRFVVQNGEGRGAWNKIAFRQWLKDYSELHYLVIIRVLVLSGSPPRVAELLAMLLCNTRSRPERNLSLLDQFVVLITRYHKSGALTGADRLLPHALDAFTSSIVIHDCVFARSMAQLAAMVVWPKDLEIAQLYYSRLFVKNGREFTTDDISKRMSRHFLPFLHFNLNVSSWRHIGIAFRRKFIAAVMDFISGKISPDSMGALLCSHNKSTEDRLYGVSPAAGIGLSEDIAADAVKASCDWHLHMGVVPGNFGCSIFNSFTIAYGILLRLGGILKHHSKVGYAEFDSLLAEGVFNWRKGSSSLLSDIRQVVSEEVQQLLQKMFPEHSESQGQVSQSQVARAPRAGVVLATTQSQPSGHPDPDTQTSLQAEPPLLPPFSLPSSLNHLGEEEATSSFPQDQVPSISPPMSYRYPSSQDEQQLPRFSQSPTSRPSSRELDPASLPVDAREMESRALLQLKTLLSSDATWKCPEQATAVVTALQLQRDMVAVLGTGSGKSMIFIIPTLLEKNAITICMLPLKSLIWDFSRRLKDMKVGFEVFGDESTVITGDHNLVLVSLDRTGSPNWNAAVARCPFPIMRIVIDESHLILTASNYRPSLSRAYSIRKAVSAQVILLSGTIPPSSIPDLIHACELDRPLVLRTSSNHPNHIYHLERIGTTKEAIERAKTLWSTESRRFHQADRALVFVPTLDLGRAMAGLLKCGFYTGDREISDDLQRAQIYSEWINGVNKVMVCTSAFGAGNDWQSIPLVIFVGVPREMVDTVQEFDRGGRNGRPCDIHIIPNSMPSKPDLYDSIDHSGKLAAYNFLHYGLKGYCLRALITGFLDGSPIYCTSDTKNLKCNKCANRASKSQHFPKTV